LQAAGRHCGEQALLHARSHRAGHRHPAGWNDRSADRSRYRRPRDAGSRGGRGRTPAGDRARRGRSVTARGAVALVLTAVTFGCGPTAAPEVAAPPPPSDQQKLEWILELEDQRVARGPAPGQDLIAMLSDPMAHIRRRAAHAAGRARLVEAVPALTA